MVAALRLPPHLDALARLHADDMGVSVNGLICVVLHAHFKANLLPAAAGISAVAARLGQSDIPATGGKSGVKKETFKERQRARDTAFQPEKAAK